MPLRNNEGRPFPIDEYVRTREELLARFEAISFEPGPVQGTWIHKQIRYEDASARIFVVCEDTASNEQFFIEYKEVLKERFEQLEMWITVHPIRIV